MTYGGVQAESLAGQVHALECRIASYRHHAAQANALLAKLGWLPFGSLVEHDGEVEFSDELDIDGLPLWERKVT